VISTRAISLLRRIVVVVVSLDIRFVCLAHEGAVRLNMREFSRYRWLRLPVPKSLDWIGGIKGVLGAIQVDQLPNLNADEQLRKTTCGAQEFA